MFDPNQTAAIKVDVSVSTRAVAAFELPLLVRH